MKKILILATLALASLPVYAQTVQTYCSGIAGNIACTSYDNSSSSQSYCTSIGGNLSCTTYGHTDQYNQAQVQQNYAVGYALGTALGNVVENAIRSLQEHRQVRRDYEQRIQDVLASTELQCETSSGSDPIECRTETLAFNQFFHHHLRDFVANYHNMSVLTSELEKEAASGMLSDAVIARVGEEQVLEQAYSHLDRNSLTK